MAEFQVGAGEVGLRNTLNGTVYGHSVQAATINGDVYLSGGGEVGPERRVPRQLPSGPRHFTDRVEAFDALDSAISAASDTGSSALAVISGPPGVGKTSLALSWLHRHSAQFPDGQLYVDLQGHMAADQPVVPSSVLPGFLRAFGVRPDQVPADLAEQTALYRTLTAGRRVAVFCDNAFSAAQIRPLVPTSPGSVCVVSSRWRLTSLLLDGARILPLEPLDTDAALQLLGRIVGQERIAADGEAARELVVSCGCFPLAVCVGGALLTVRPGWSVAAAAADLSVGLRSEASDEEFSMIACLDQAYAALSPEAARLYRRLGLHPGSEFDLGVAEAVAEAAPVVEDVSHRLAALVESNLLANPSPRRYRFHDLIQHHALGRAQRDEPEGERVDAVRRIVTHYLVAADAADAVLYPQRSRPAPKYSVSVCLSTEFTDRSAALNWFDAERGNLVAVQRLASEYGMDSETWQIADAMWGLFSYLRYYDDWISTHEIGAAAARTCGHSLGEARLRNGLGVALRAVGRNEEALSEFDAAVALRRQIGDRRGEALGLRNMALAYEAQEDLDEALTLLRRALAIQEDFGTSRDRANSHSAIGEVESLRGRHAEAISHLSQARETVAGTQDRYEMVIERNLGMAHLRAGDRKAARRHLGTAVELLASTGTVFDEGEVREILAAMAEQDGELTSARDHYVRAEAVYTKLAATQEAGRVAEHLIRLRSIG